MVISFDTRSLRELCEVELVARAEFGDQVAEEVFTHLADLDAAETLFEVPTIDPDIDDKDYVHIHLINGSELVFKCGHSRPPLREDGRVDWALVKRIKIMAVG